MSNTNSVSVGPPHASGWNWVEKNGLVLCLMPSLVPSFMFTKYGSQSALSEVVSTAKP